MTTTTATTLRELDHRSGNGIHVSLLWDSATGRVTVELYDEALDEALEFEAPPHRALDAFNHPFAYAPSSESWPATSPAEAVDA